MRILILGAGGRDFHNFNVLYRHRADVEVIAFTASQIPFQVGRRYPPCLSGPLYPKGIPIIDENDLGEIARRLQIDTAVFSYSDIAHSKIMDVASRLLATGCDFTLIGSERTMLKSALPVVSVCAVRTGCGKSAVTRYVCRLLQECGVKPVIVRHPMAYGPLEGHAVQAFFDMADLDRYGSTLEEREEYEPLLRLGVPLFAGVDYEAILAVAEKSGDVLIWDGGNNDTPFFIPDLEIVLVDPLRVGDELSYYPGYINLLRAHVVVISKFSGVPGENIQLLRQNIQPVISGKLIVQGDLDVHVERPVAVAGRRVVVVEDGPTVTHGGMAFGAGVVAARRFGAREIVDPRPYAVGSLKKVYADYPHIGRIVPAMGYSPGQLNDLKRTLLSVPCDLILSATPVDLGSLLGIGKDVLRVSYEFTDAAADTLSEKVKQKVSHWRG